MEAAEAAPPESPANARTERGNRRRKASKGSRQAQYWMVVSSPENFRKSQQLGFSVQGIKSRHRRRVEQMRSGDRLLYYVTGRMAFSATVTLTSSMFEERSLIWRSARRDEVYPWRIRIRADQVLQESVWILARELAYRMEYVRKWPPEHWTLAFQGHLHQLPQKDFKLIEDEFLRVNRSSPLQAGS